MERLRVLLQHVVPTPHNTVPSPSYAIRPNFVSVANNCSFAPKMYYSIADDVIATEFYEENVKTGMLEKIWPL